MVVWRLPNNARLEFINKAFGDTLHLPRSFVWMASIESSLTLVDAKLVMGHSGYGRVLHMWSVACATLIEKDPWRSFLFKCVSKKGDDQLCRRTKEFPEHFNSNYIAE